MNRHALTGMRRGESNLRIEIFANIRNGQKEELGTPCPELVLLTVPNPVDLISIQTPALVSYYSGGGWCPKKLGGVYPKK